VLALLSASLPLAMTLTTVMCAVSEDGGILDAPSIKDLRTATSIHVLGFSSKGALLVNESEGTFDFETWERVHEHGTRICRGSAGQEVSGEDVMMLQGSMEGFVREVLKEKAAKDQTWGKG
jgi:exosome complex component RRP46